MEDKIKLFLEIVYKIISFLSDNKKLKSQKYLYIKEEDMKIDCYEFLKQITTINRALVPTKLINNYYIDRYDYYEDYIFEARCVNDSYSSYEFSIASTTLKKYEDTECVGYDLMNNPDVEIRPKLISPDSFAKRLSLQLNKVLNKNDILKVRIKDRSYGSMYGNKRYIIQGFNYKKLELSEYKVFFNFTERIPNNIRIYEINPFNNTYCFLYKIFPNSNENNVFQDNFNVKNIKNHNKYLYIF